MFGHRVTLFRAFAFPVRIDASCAPLALLVTWGLAVGYFPHLLPGLPVAVYWSMGFLGFVGLAASIVAHELAHAVVGERFGMHTRGITLFLFGGVAEIEDEPPTPRAETLMALAGPAASLVLALACGGLGLVVPAAAASIFMYLAFINGLLAAFNLVPAFPLDGGRVLRAALWRWSGDVAWATRMAGGTGGALGLALMLAGIWQIAVGNLLGGVWWVLIGLFVRAAAAATVRQHKQLRAFQGERVWQLMRSHPVSVSPRATLAATIADYFETYYLSSFPVTDDARLVGQLRLERVRAVPPARWPHLTVAEVMEDYPPEAVVAADCEAVQALAQMRRGGRRHLMVVRDDDLVGILTLSALRDFMASRHRFGPRRLPANDDSARRTGVE